MALTVDVISDVICPWCYIGKRRLEAAIRTLGPDHPVTIHWHPFELNPAMPPEGIDRRTYRTRKFGSWERSQQLDAHVAAVGAQEGLHFAFDRIARTPNTRDAHRLIWLAGQAGVQDAVVEALFRAYFTDGRDLSDRAVLVAVVSEAGLERERAERLLAGDEGVSEVGSAEDRARRLGVEGVPFFVLGRRRAVSGAQAVEVFVGAFNELIAGADHQRVPEA